MIPASVARKCPPNVPRHSARRLQCVGGSGRLPCFGVFAEPRRAAPRTAHHRRVTLLGCPGSASSPSHAGLGGWQHPTRRVMAGVARIAPGLARVLLIDGWPHIV